MADAAEALDETDELTKRAVSARELFPEPSIGADGLVQEWRGIDALEDPQHRHMVHLVFVHPLDGEPTGPLADAARPAYMHLQNAGSHAIWAALQEKGDGRRVLGRLNELTAQMEENA